MLGALPPSCAKCRACPGAERAKEREAMGERCHRERSFPAAQLLQTLTQSSDKLATHAQMEVRGAIHLTIDDCNKGKQG